MIQGSNIYGRIETIETALVNRDRSTVKDCSTCRFEISDWNRSEAIKKSIRAGVFPAPDNYCSEGREDSKSCTSHWKKKRDA